MANNFSDIQSGANALIDGINSKVKELHSSIGSLNTNITTLLKTKPTSGGLNDQLKKTKTYIDQVEAASNKIISLEKKKKIEMDRLWSQRKKQIDDQSKAEQKKANDYKKAQQEVETADRKAIALKEKRRIALEKAATAETEAIKKQAREELKVIQQRISMNNSLRKQKSKEASDRLKDQSSMQSNREALQRQKAAYVEMNRPYSQLIAKHKQSRKALQDASTAYGKNSKETRAAQREYDKLSKKVNQANVATKNFSKGGLGSAIRGLKNLVGAFGVVTGFALIGQVARDAFNLTKQIDSMAFSMKAVIKDSAELHETQGFLRQVAQDYGADLLTVTNRYIKFRAATQQAGLTAKETQNIFSTMTKAAGVLGLKKDELQGIFLALEQMVSKGKITTEELRRQLGERLPGAMDIMANSLGKTTAELDEMLKKGEVITKDVLPGFAREVEIAFGLKNIDKVETLQAATSRLGNAWVILVEDFNNGNKASEALMTIFDALANNLGSIVKLIGYATLSFITYKTVMATAWVVTQLFNKALWEERILLALVRAETIKATIATKGFTRALLTNPIVLAVAALTALYFALRDTGDEAKLAKDEMIKMNQEMTDSNRAIADTVSEVKNLIDRYEELKDKANKSVKEQKELKDVIIALGEAVPDAVTELDAYNNALAIGTDAAKQWVKENSALGISKSNDVIASTTKLLKEQESELKKVNEIRKGNTVENIKGFAEVRMLEDGSIQVKKRSNLAFRTLENSKRDNERTSFLEYMAETEAKVNSSKKLIEVNEDLQLIYGVAENNRQREERLKKEAADAEAKRLKEEFDNEDKILKLKTEIAKNESRLKELREDSVLEKEKEEILKLVDANSKLNSELEKLLGNKKKGKKEEEIRAKNLVKVNALTLKVAKGTSQGTAQTVLMTQAIKEQISVMDEVLKDLPEWSEGYIKLKKHSDDLKDALKGIEATQGMKDVEEWSERFAKAQEKAKEKAKELADELKGFFKDFQDEFFSEAGFDFLNDMFGDIDEEGLNKFQQLLKAADASDDIDQWQVYFATISELGQEAFNFLNQNSQAYFDREYERLEKQKDIALQFAGDSSTAREEIERQYEARRKVIQDKQARAEKQQAMFNIAINTAQAIVATLGQAGFAGIPLSVIVGAIGAAQMAMVAATPVPEFFRGTQNAPEGWALVDEKQPEIHTDRQGNIKSTGEGKANHRWLSAGDKIYTSHEEYFNKELGGILQGNDILPYKEFISSSPIVNVESGIKKEDFVREISRLGEKILSKETSITKIDKNGFYTGVRKKGHETERQNSILTLKGGIV